MRRRVALVASQSCVFTFERISGLFVIETLDLPLDQRKIFAVMLGMTAGALLARTRGDVIRRVQSFMCVEPVTDFVVAIEALQRSLTTKLVATGALCRTVERLMRSRKWAGRDLRECSRRECQQNKVQKNGTQQPVVSTESGPRHFRIPFRS